MTPHDTVRWAPQVDDIAVERACAGDSVPLTALERREAVAILTRRRLSGNAIAARLGLARRSVVRHQKALAVERAALREAAA